MRSILLAVWCGSSIAGPLAAQGVPALQAVREITVDGKTAKLDVDTRVRVNANGTIAIAGIMGKQILLVDRDMRKLQVLGTPGEKPGAINLVQFYGWVGDSLWVVDPSLKRLTIFTPERAVARTVTLPFTAEGPPGSMLVDHSSMPLIITAVYPGGDLLTNDFLLQAQMHLKGLSYLLRLTSTGTYAGGMGSTNSPTEQCRLPDSTLSFRGWREFCFAPPTVTSPNGKFAVTVRMPTTADPAHYSVTKIGERGDTIYSRSYPFTAAPVTPYELDSAVAKQLGFAQWVAHPMNAEGFRRTESLIRSLTPATHAPVLNPVLPGDDGTVWLNLSSNEPGRHWLELDAAGNPVGTFAVPANVMLLQAEHGTAWGREILPDSTINIVRYHIGPARKP